MKTRGARRRSNRPRTLDRFGKSDAVRRAEARGAGMKSVELGSVLTAFQVRPSREMRSL